MKREYRTCIAISGIAATLAGGCERAPEPPGATETQLVERVSVGVLDGDDREVFGHIAEIRGAADGSFLVLDRQQARVSWFGPEGTYRGGILGRGAGPGELSQPISFHLTATGSLFVIDPPNGRYSFYSVDNAGVRYAGAIPALPLAPSASRMCSIGDRLFLRAALNGQLIQEIDRAGRVLRSFQPAREVSRDEFGHAAALVAAQQNSGLLLCLEHRDLIVSVSTYLPHVMAYTSAGELAWQTQIADLRPLHFRPAESPRGGVRFEPDDSGSHLAQTVVAWTDSSFLVQYSVTWPEGTLLTERDRDFYALESRELLLDTGREISKPEHLPLIVDARNGSFYSFQNLPYPRVRVLTRGN